MKKKTKRKNKIVKSGMIGILIIIVLCSILKGIEVLWLMQKEIIPKNVTRTIGKDGYTTMYSTQEEKVKTYKEYKQGGEASWANKPYWDNEMWDNGCGITAIAILATGYGKNVTPEDLRKKYYPHLEGDKIGEALQEDFKIQNTDFYYGKQYIEKSYILKWLESNRPILICVVNTPNERWTKSSHYMLLLGRDGDKVYVSNPNAQDGNNKSSGWYTIEEILPYIAKILFIEDT